VKLLTARDLLRVTPTRYLVLTNIISAGIGFLTGAYVARVLGPERLGVTAVITGINTSIVAFIDVRLSDVAARAFYQVADIPTDQVPAYRAGVLWVALFGTGLLAGGMALLSALIGNLFVHVFTATPVMTWWLPIGAATLALNTIIGTLGFLWRFSGAFYYIGTWRIVSQLVNAGITLSIIALSPDISGMYLSGLAAAMTGLILAGAFSWMLWTWRTKLPLRRPAWRPAYAVYRRSWRMLFYGNLLGYAKLLQRSADVLLVGLFTGDRETGLYKLSRSLVDAGLAVLQDALYQVYYPSFLDIFARRAQEEYRRLAGRLLGFSSLITAALLAGEALLLPTFVRVIFGPAYTGVEAPMMILTATFVFIVGFYPWLWALFTGSGDLRGYTIAVFAAIVVQYGVALSLFALVGPSAWAAMIGAFAHYVFLIPVAYGYARARWGQFVLWVSRPTAEAR
jgi:O-antigen/teichoic acid export membrane protein